MALSKSGKLWITVFSILIGLFIVALIGAKLYFTGDRLKALIIPKIEAATNRTVTVADIGLSVFPTVGVSIDGLTISNPPGTAFDKENMVALDHMKISVKILPLLSKKVEIRYITLDHPVIYLERTKEGVKNYSSKKPGEAPAPEAAPSQGSPAQLLLSNLEINNGEVEMVNKQFDSWMVIGGLHQTASVETSPDGKGLVIEGESKIEQFSYGTLTSWYLSGQPVEAKTKLSYHLGKDVLSFDDVKATVKELPLTVAGTISQLQQDVNIMDLTVSTPGAQMAQLLSLVPPDMLKKAKGLNSSGEVKFSAAIKGRSSEEINPGTHATFTVSNGKIQYSGLPKSITNVNVSGMFDKPEAPLKEKGIGSFALDKFTASLGSNTISGSMKVANFDDPQVSASFDGKMNLAEVKEFYPLEEGSDFSGNMTAAVRINGKAKTPQTLKANGNVNFQDVTLKTAGSPQPLRNLNGTITFNNQSIESKQLAMNIGQSDMQLAFALKNYLGMVMPDAAKTAGKPSATVTLRSKLLRTADLMSAKGADTTGAGKKKKGTEKQQTGMLPGVDVDANVSIDKLETEKFTFSNARGTVALTGGVANLKNFSVNAFNGTIQSKGMLDFRDPTKRPFNLDLNVAGVESNAMLSNFTSFGKYLFGKMSLNTKMQGDLNDTLGLNPQTLLGNGKVQVTDGKLLGLPVMNQVASLTNLTDLKEVNFKNWANAFSIADGRVNVKDLKINAGPTEMLVGGSQGLDGTLDYTLALKLPESVSNRLTLPGAANNLVQFLKDKEGKINLNFVVGGAASSPNVRLDLHAQEEMAKQQLLNQGKQKAEDELKKKAEEGLKKLFKRP